MGDKTKDEKIKEKQRQLHDQLLIEINDELDSTSSDYAAFKMQITKPLGGAGVLGRCEDLFAIYRQLGRRNKLGVLNYGTLKEAFARSNNVDIVNLIERKEKEIINVEADETETETAGPDVSKKRKLEKEEVDPSDGRFTTFAGLPHYETSGKTGFLLIINFTFKNDKSTTSREGLKCDISTLTNFFEDTLNFDVVVLPGNQPSDDADLTTGQVTTALMAVRNYLNKGANARKYYCFMCVILSHGDDGKFKTRDGYYCVNDFRKIFSNTEMMEFAAKPKIFIIQSCQGREAQGWVLFDDQSDDENKDNNVAPVDESDNKPSVPKDGDILFVFATTPGYGVNANPFGTYLISVMVDVFRSCYTNLHLEDMMITVRDNLSKVLLPAGGSIVSMMPYTWSTLTKRLRFTVGLSTWGSGSNQREKRPIGHGNDSVLIDSVLT